MGLSVMLSEVPKNWCLPNTGALTVHNYALDLDATYLEWKGWLMTVQLLLHAVFTYGTPYVYKVYILSRWGWPSSLKEKFPQTAMWIGWVKSNSRNQTVKVWANLDNPFRSYSFVWFPMLPSLDSTCNSARICDTTREQLSTDFVH